MSLLKGLLDDWDGPIRVLRTGYLYAQEEPQAKQSMRFGGKSAWTDPKKKKYVKALSKAFKEQHVGRPLTGLLRLSVIYGFPFTQEESAFLRLGWSLTDKCIDLDNLLKPVKDALKKIVMVDDSQVVDVRARKIRYVEGGIIALRIDEISVNRSWTFGTGIANGNSGSSDATLKD